MLPSTLLVLAISRWARGASLAVRAFATGMAPLTLGLLLATGWVLAVRARAGAAPGALAVIAVTIVTMLKTRLSPIWLVALGAVVGALGGI